MINKATMELVMGEEAFMAKEYSDRGKPAIAYGRRDGFRGFKITPGMTVTKDQAYVWLRSDLYFIASKILLILGTTKATDNQLGAFCSFSYNLGTDALKNSTLMKKFKDGDISGAADQFLVWNKAKDKDGKKVPLAGLTRRRKKERELFLT